MKGAIITKHVLNALSGVVPVSLSSNLELAFAYLQGKGAGNDTCVAAEVKASSRFLKGDQLVIFDVGANRGDWTEAALARLGSRLKTIYQFEPSSANVATLQERFTRPEISIFRCAVSDNNGTANLYFNSPGSVLASLYRRKLDHFNISMDQAEEVQTVTIDSFIADHGIGHIDLLKMDIEGDEMAALKGATDALRKGTIGALTFEFGGANIDSRTYFQDFWYFLTPLGFSLYRISPNGSAIVLNQYSETCEYYRASNYLAVRRDSLLR